jgi:hypothetical protein
MMHAYAHAMQCNYGAKHLRCYIIDLIIWLKETLLNFGVQTVHVENFLVDNGPLIQCRITFSITARMG